MALIITEQKVTFYLQGNLNSSNLNSLSQHLKYILNIQSEIAINIKGLKKVDNEGLLSLKKIQNYAVSKSKKLTIDENQNSQKINNNVA